MSELSAGEDSWFEYAAPTGNIRVFVKKWGQGPPLLILHGWASSNWAWRKLAPLMGVFFQVHAMDIPGFGRTKFEGGFQLEFVIQLICAYTGQLGMRWHIMGSSLGGRLALILGQKFPDLFYPPVAISPPISFKPSARMRFFLRMTFPILRLPFGIYIFRFFSWLIWSRREMRQTNSLIPYLEPLHQNPGFLRAASEALLWLSEHEITDDDIKATQGLVLWGKKDRVLSPSQALRRLEHLTFQIHPSGGHHLMEDEPDWVCEKALAFWRVSPRSSSPTS